jgi:hypothetical protein
MNNKKHSVKFSTEQYNALVELKTKLGLPSISAVLDYLLEIRENSFVVKKENKYGKMIEEIKKAHPNEKLTVRFLQSKSRNGLYSIPREIATEYVKNNKPLICL